MTDAPFQIDWKNPDYLPIFQHRVAFLNRIRSKPEMVPALKTHYKHNIADFIRDWGVTLDPRNVERDLPAVVPFLLFPKQIEWINWTEEHWRGQKPGITEKSRDGGLSWLAVAYACTKCLFNDGFAAGFGSRKEEYVDKIGEPKSLFYKARMFMKYLPKEFRGGWLESKHAPFMRLVFPETGSYITGEAGDNIGRGNRAQPLDAMIVTPTGLRPMGEMRVGDFVIGANGQPTKIIGVYPQGKKDIFKVRFSDGAETECCDDHLWQITTSAMRKSKSRKPKKPRAPHFKVLPLSELRENLVKDRNDGQTEYAYQIPMLSAPVQFNPVFLPLNPYLVGALLGDGAIAHDKISPGFTTADAEMLAILEACFPPNYEFVSDGSPYGYRIVSKRGTQGKGANSPLKHALREIGIMGLNSHNKFIPDIYKYASVDDRLELLRGLMDTDGWIREQRSKNGAPQISIVSTSARLISDIQFVVQSLGGVAYKTGVPAGTRTFPSGKTYDCRAAFCLTLNMPNDMNPFVLQRKAYLYENRSTYKPSRSMISVEYAGQKETQCIRVAADDHLYLTDGCIVTHNTSVFFVDEAAHLERPLLVEASLSQTTNCRIDISSVNGNANVFAQKRHSGKIDVFTFFWRDDPRKDDAWYAKMCAELDPVIVAQEIDINYSASVEGVLIPLAWVQAAVDAHVKLQINPTGKRSASLDMADEGKDNCAVLGRHGIMLEYLEEWSGAGSDPFASSVRAFNICDQKGYPALKYDADGLGASVRGDARIINEERARANKKPINVEAFRGSGAVFNPKGEDVKGRLNEDFFQNAKAQAWWNLRLRFQRTFRAVTEGIVAAHDDLISIPSELPLKTKLITELTQPTYTISNNGKVQVDKKPDGTKSPNLSDCVMMEFAQTQRAPMQISNAALASSSRQSAPSQLLHSLINAQTAPSLKRRTFSGMR